MDYIYAGSSELAAKALYKLYRRGRTPLAVITQPDRPVGRRQIMTATPVRKMAQRLHLTCYTFENIGEHAEEISDLHADLLFACAYGQIIPQHILDIFPHGAYNIHPSLLPKYRGATPIQTALLNGDEHTGYTVYKMTQELDAGPILYTTTWCISGWTYDEAEMSMGETCGDILAQCLGTIESYDGNVDLREQSTEGVSYCKKWTKNDVRLNFNQKTARELRNMIKAFMHEPKAFCVLGNKMINVLNAEVTRGKNEPGKVVSYDGGGIVVGCKGNESLYITKVQFSGGKVLDMRSVMNGRKIQIGDKFS